MGMTCSACDGWSETIYNNDGVSKQYYCPLCGAGLVSDPPEWDAEEDDGKDAKGGAK